MKAFFVFSLILSALLYAHCNGPFNRSGGGGVYPPGTPRSPGGQGGGSQGRDSGYGSGHGGDDICAVARDGCTPGRRNNNDDDDDEPSPSVRSVYQTLEDRYGGGYADLRFASRNNIQDYRLGKVSNFPIEDGRVFVELDRVSGNSYYEGTVVVSYELEKTQGNTTLKYQEFYARDRDAKYNLWAQFDDRKFGFHGFFQNDYEAIILVVDKLYDASGEGDNRVFSCDPSRTDCPNADNALGTGSIWFKTFRNEGRGSCHDNGKYINYRYWHNPPEKRCWFISVGPFDCRAWKTSERVDTFRALEPRNSCYKKLADFNFPQNSKRLPIGEAFGEDHIIIHDRSNMR